MLRIPRQLSRRVVPHRSFYAFSRHPVPSSPFKDTPSPPRLPKEEQEIFERLQRQSTGAFSTPRDLESEQPPESTAAASPDARFRINQSPGSSPDVVAEGEELHPHIRRGAPPEFEGDVNPKTGEVGGPKNEPLRWGGESDWSYNGRVTDF